MDLGSLNKQDLDNIINSLSQSDIDELLSTASAFFGSQDKKQEPSQKKSDGKAEDFNFDMETIMKISRLMKKLSCRERNPGCELIEALKPFLSPQRKIKAQRAIEMLEVMSIIPLIEEMKNQGEDIL